MNVLVLSSILAFFILSEAKSFDKEFLICDWVAPTGNGTEEDNEAETTIKAAQNREITGIYEWNENLQYLVNLQIRLELIAFYNYLSMSRFFHKYDQDRQGFAKYLRKGASEELEHSELFMKYQQMRGGEVAMYNIPPPEEHKWRHAKDVLNSAYLLEKKVTDEILCLHREADKYKDIDFLNFLEDKIIPEQYESMKELKSHIKSLERACPGNSDMSCSAYPVYEMQYDTMLKGKGDN